MRHAAPLHGTTILAVRQGGTIALAGDGQVTLGQTVVKHHAKKIQRLHNGQVLAGFAGSTADAMALIHRFEARLEEYRGNLQRAAVELAKEWRTDRSLRRLEAFLIVADRDATFLLSGAGDVIAPDDGIVAVGSGRQRQSSIWKKSPLKSERPDSHSWRMIVTYSAQYS